MKLTTFSKKLEKHAKNVSISATGQLYFFTIGSKNCSAMVFGNNVENFSVKTGYDNASQETVCRRFSSFRDLLSYANN